MDKSKLSKIGKWIFIIFFIAINFFFYQINETPINLIVALLVIFYSIYEYHQLISLPNIKIALKIMLYIIYSFALLSLFLIVQNFILGSYAGIIRNLILLCANMGIIFMLLRKFRNI